jgi:hypothetical protein
MVFGGSQRPMNRKLPFVFTVLFISATALYGQDRTFHHSDLDTGHFKTGRKKNDRHRLFHAHPHSRQKVHARPSVHQHKKTGGLCIQVNPFHQGHFSITADVKQFSYSNRQADILLNIPYTLESGSTRTDSVFTGSYHKEPESSHPEFRTHMGFDFGFPKGPSFNLSMSISSSTYPYGRFMNYDFFEAGMHYDLGICRKGPGHAPRLLLCPYLGYLRRDKDYRFGSINVPSTLIVNGKKIQNTSGRPVGVTYGDLDVFLCPGLGIWYMPAGSGRSKAPLVSFRLLVTYDMPFWGGGRVYLTDGDSGFAYRYFRSPVTRQWLTITGDGRVHRYDGLSVSIGMLVSLWR